jgi:DNA gyrase subunit B
VSDSVDAISVRESVRTRAAMFVGETSPRGILALVLDQVARAMDDHDAGECHRLDVTMNGDAITVRDDGPGLPLDSARFLDVPVGDRPGPSTGGGVRESTHFIGIGAVRALTTELELSTIHRGRALRIAYRDGEPLAQLTSVPTSEPSGTTIRLRPDPAVFGHEPLPRRELVERLEALARDLPDLRLTWSLGDVAP